MNTAIVEALKKIVDWAPTLEPLLRKVLGLGKEGVVYIQNFLECSSLNKEIRKKNKEIEGYYQKIGKEVYNKKISIKELEIKDNIRRIEKCKESIDKNNKRLEEISVKTKNVEIFNDLPELKDLVEKLEEAETNKKKNNTKSKKENVKKKKTKKNNTTK